MMLRASAAALALLAVCSTPGSRSERKWTTQEPYTQRQLWVFDATYVDRKHGASFRYPSIWKAADGFGYHPPALTLSSVAKPLAGFGYVEGGFPRDHVVGPYSGTNLEGFGIVYSPIPAGSSGKCESVATSVAGTSQHGTVAFGRQSFSVRVYETAGMSQSERGELYSAYVWPTCYLFETDVAVSTGAVGNGDIQALSREQLRVINANLLNIVKSVNIEPLRSNR